MRALLLALVCCAANASPTLSSDPFPAAPNQPTSCTVDASGRPLPCLLKPAPGGLILWSDLSVLPPGIYVIVATVSTVNLASCTGGPAAFICDGGGGTAAAASLNLTVRAGVSPPGPVVRITFP